MNDIVAVPAAKQAGYQPGTQNKLLKRARRILTGSATFEDRYFYGYRDAVELIETLRSMECKIAFTAGVFDMFHIGHGDYLHHGKQDVVKLYPDVEHVVLVVGVDSDEVVKSRKGPTRPVVPMDERCRVLEHIRAVDIIVAQTEENQLYCNLPYDARIISTSTSDLPDFEEIKRYCEHLVNLPPQAETSTTARIRQLALEGKMEGLKEGREGTIIQAQAEVASIFERLRNEVG
jgi:D-beta-D-heptose 7-phosphate kinase/D-beta-D-heptose 1-phosphate adenosyltransferase